MLTVEITLDSECLLRQMGADLDLSPEAVAGLLLESALVGQMSR